MADIKQVTFIGDHINRINPADKIANEWFHHNKDSINVVSGTYNVELSEEQIPDYHKAITLRYIGESGHNPQDCPHIHIKKETVLPTCFSDGSIKSTCIDCGKYLGETVIAKVDHNYSLSSNNDATCIKDGTKTGICSYCQKKIIVPDLNSAFGHNYIYHSDDNATCTEDGTETGICTRCNDSITIPDPDSAYGHNYTFTPDNNATCTEDGTETGRCYHGDSEITRPLPGSALGHNIPNIWTIRTPATEQSTGLEFKKCSRCDYEETRIITKLEHTWVSNGNGTHKCTTVGGCNVTNETCSPNDYGQTCTKCGYHTPEDTTLIITTDYINGMTVGNAFSQMITTNISSGVDWDLVGGNTPPGVIFYRTGELKGTPSKPGIYKFTIKAIYHSQEVTKEFSVNVANILYTVTFNAFGGSVNESTRQVPQGSTIGELPTATKDGFNFGGWFTSAEGGLKVNSTYTVSSDVTLYARWGEGTDVDFGDVTTQFNIQYNGDRTNYGDNPYAIYYRNSNGSAANLAVQTGVSSTDKSSNMSPTNKTIKFYMKVTNNDEAGNFDIGFDCDSYVQGNDKVSVTRISNGVQLGSFFSVTVPYTTSIWVGQYNQRTQNRWNNMNVGSNSGSVDSGYAYTIKDVFINSGSYAILEVTFQMM